MKKIIGVTGGLGAGKSTVMSILEEECHGEGIRMDQLGRELMEPKGPCYAPVVELFSREAPGETVVRMDGSLDREKISSLVFQDGKLLAGLNAIVHPAVKIEVNKRIAQSKAELVALESALLLEEQYDQICDSVWYVYVSVQERVKRLYEGRGYSEVKSYSIIKNQMSENQFMKACQVLIDNSKTFEETRKQVLEAVRQESLSCR